MNTEIIRELEGLVTQRSASVQCGKHLFRKNYIRRYRDTDNCTIFTIDEGLIGQSSYGDEFDVFYREDHSDEYIRIEVCLLLCG